MRQEMKELAHNDGFMAKEHPILGGMEDLVVTHMGWFAGLSSPAALAFCLKLFDVLKDSLHNS
jgi:hypothetical protein